MGTQRPVAIVSVATVVTTATPSSRVRSITRAVRASFGEEKPDAIRIDGRTVVHVNDRTTRLQDIGWTATGEAVIDVIFRDASVVDRLGPEFRESCAVISGQAAADLRAQIREAAAAALAASIQLDEDKDRSAGRRSRSHESSPHPTTTTTPSTTSTTTTATTTQLEAPVSPRPVPPTAAVPITPEAALEPVAPSPSPAKTPIDETPSRPAESASPATSGLPSTRSMRQRDLTIPPRQYQLDLSDEILAAGSCNDLWVVAGDLGPPDARVVRLEWVIPENGGIVSVPDDARLLSSLGVRSGTHEFVAHFVSASGVRVGLQ